MAEKKTIELEVKTDSVKSLKTQLKEAQQEVQVLAEKFGATSREATEAAKKAAKLKDEIGDAKALTDAFNPDAKFNALNSALGGVAGGFSAVQGAMGLMGGESENVQKALLKVQSAMALSQGINSVMGAKDAFTNLAAQIGKTTIGQRLLTAAQVVGAATMRVLNMVMNANPVLLLVTGVTALVGAMALLRSSQEAAAVTASDLNEELEKQQALTESISKDTEVLNKLDLAYARERGASEEELTKIKEKSSQDQINILYKNWIATQKTFDKIKALYSKDKATLEEYNSAKKKEQESYDKWNDAKNAKIVSDAEADADKAEKLREEQAKKQEKANEKAEERRRKKAEVVQKAKNDALKNEAQNKSEVLQKIIEAENNYEDSRLTNQEKEIRSVQDKYFELIELAKQYGLDTSTLENARLNEINIINKKYNDELKKFKENAKIEEWKQEEDFYNNFNNVTLSQKDLEINAVRDKYFTLIELAKQYGEDITILEKKRDAEINAINTISQQQKLKMALDAFGILQDATTLFTAKNEKDARRQFKINKALSLSSAIVNTAMAVTSALATVNPVPGGRFIEAGIAAASGAVSIAKISATQFGGFGGGDSGGGGNKDIPSTPNPSSGVIAPKFNVVGGSSNQLNTLQQQPIQAYVVSGDVTSAQSLDRNRIKNATL